MTEQIKDLELVSVEYDNGTATLTFLDSEQGEIREVNIRKTKYDQDKKKQIPDEQAAIRAEETAMKYLGVSFDEIEKLIPQSDAEESHFFPVYIYEKFNSLKPVVVIEKFTTDEVGAIFSTPVIEVFDDGKGIHIQFEEDGKLRQSNMGYSKYDEKRKEWFVNPQQKVKQYAKFEEKFGIKVENMKELVGKEIMIEIKLAFGTAAYAEIKPFPKKKK